MTSAAFWNDSCGQALAIGHDILKVLRKIARRVISQDIAADTFASAVASEVPTIPQQAAIKTMRRARMTTDRTFSLRGGAIDYPTHVLNMNEFQLGSCAGDTLTSYYEISERMGDPLALRLARAAFSRLNTTY
jgi:hypothetical protein